MFCIELLVFLILDGDLLLLMPYALFISKQHLLRNETVTFYSSVLPVAFVLSIFTVRIYLKTTISRM